MYFCRLTIFWCFLRSSYLCSITLLKALLNVTGFIQLAKDAVELESRFSLVKDRQIIVSLVENYLLTIYLCVESECSTKSDTVSALSLFEQTLWL